MKLPVAQPSRVTVMIKPVGALCNLDCHYCYYLPTKTVYDGHEHKMTLKTLEEVFAGLLPHFADEVTVAWQGGEPTLAGLEFFEKAIEFQQKHARPNQVVRHALQTNGTLLNDEWCSFLRRHDVLVGLSVDGPPKFHDKYRLTNSQNPSSDLVLQGLRKLQSHAVEYNILCVLNDFNVKHPDEILRYLLNLGSRWVQFIPAIEWEPDPKRPGHNALAPYSPSPEDYGKFLCRVFDLWFKIHRNHLSVRFFDAVISKMVLGEMPFCILDAACHNQMTIEHDGSVFGCDHFIERRWQLAQMGDPEWQNPINLDGSHDVGLTIHGDGYLKHEAHAGRNIHNESDLPTHSNRSRFDDQPLDDSWLGRTDGDRLGQFAQRKQSLPEKCLSCQWKPYCHGGCPKHRSFGGDAPEPTVLCKAYIMFYEHAMPRLEWLASYLRQNQQPPAPEGSCQNETQTRKPNQTHQPGHHDNASSAQSPPRRNAPCPCGSGLKFKHCHGAR